MAPFIHPRAPRDVLAGEMDGSFGHRELTRELTVLLGRGFGPRGPAPGVPLPRVGRAGGEVAGGARKEHLPMGEHAGHTGGVAESIQCLRALSAHVRKQHAFGASGIPGGVPRVLRASRSFPSHSAPRPPRTASGSGRRPRVGALAAEAAAHRLGPWRRKAPVEKRMLDRSGTGTVTSTRSDSQVRPFLEVVRTGALAAMSVTGDPGTTRSPSAVRKAAGRRSLPPRILT